MWHWQPIKSNGVEKRNFLCTNFAAVGQTKAHTRKNVESTARQCIVQWKRLGPAYHTLYMYVDWNKLYRRYIYFRWKCVRFQLTSPHPSIQSFKMPNDQSIHILRLFLFGLYILFLPSFSGAFCLFCLYPCFSAVIFAYICCFLLCFSSYSIFFVLLCSWTQLCRAHSFSLRPPFCPLSRLLPFRLPRSATPTKTA